MYHYIFTWLVCRAKNKKLHSRKQHTVSVSLYGKGHIIISLWYRLAFIVNQKLKNKIYQLGKTDDRIPILQVARSRSKKLNENGNEIRIEKDGFKPGIRLRT